MGKILSVEEVIISEPTQRVLFPKWMMAATEFPEYHINTLDGKRAVYIGVIDHHGDSITFDPPIDKGYKILITVPYIERAK